MYLIVETKLTDGDYERVYAKQDGNLIVDKQHLIDRLQFHFGYIELQEFIEDDDQKYIELEIEKRTLSYYIFKIDERYETTLLKYDPIVPYEIANMIRRELRDRAIDNILS